MYERILISSPIRQCPEILSEFLLSIKELNISDIFVDYLFIDDNDTLLSDMLCNFDAGGISTTVIAAEELIQTSIGYQYNGNHNWNNSLIERITFFKNHIMKAALDGDYTHLFLVDSDLILHPETLKRLLSLQCDIVSNIFWTKFSNWGNFLPQVWSMDQKSLFDPSDPRTKNSICRTVKSKEFIDTLKTPGTYKVGGLGACTLISKRVLQSGVNFSRLYNISFWGEDRSFCIRAVAAGFELYVDTFYPAFHIYRKNYLSGVSDFKKNGFSFDLFCDELSFYEKVKHISENMKITLRCNIYCIYEKIRFKIEKLWLG